MKYVAGTRTFSGLLQEKQHRMPEEPHLAATLYRRLFRSAVTMDDSIPLKTRITSGELSLQERVVSLYEAHDRAEFARRRPKTIVGASQANLAESFEIR